MAFADDLIIRLQEGIKQYLVRPDHTIALTVLFLLGLNVVYKNLLQFGAFFFNYFIRPGKDLKGLGEWAVVTGATDGIGRAYASALAKKGDLGSAVRPFFAVFLAWTSNFMLHAFQD